MDDPFKAQREAALKRQEEARKRKNLEAQEQQRNVRIRGDPVVKNVSINCIFNGL